MQLLALSGSLRTVSRNTALLRAACRIAPASIRISVFESMGDLPLFNPDIEDTQPAPVRALKSQVAAADGLIIASPEYAHGVSGVMKNALDWLVSGEEFVEKPCALWNTSPRASHAQAALAETLATMSGRIVTSACLAIPLLGTRLTAEQIAEDRAMRREILEALQRFAGAV